MCDTPPPPPQTFDTLDKNLTPDKCQSLLFFSTLDPLPPINEFYLFPVALRAAGRLRIFCFLVHKKGERISGVGNASTTENIRKRLKGSAVQGANRIASLI